MKITVLVAFLLLCSLTPLALANQEAQGEKWQITVSDHSNRCKGIGIDFSGTHEFVLIVTTDTKRVIYDRTTGITYAGVINPAEPEIIHYTASYREDAGVVSETITFNRLEGRGNSVWYWGDGIMSCGGEYNFTASRE